MQNRGFLGRLFDLSFTEFITLNIIRFIFRLGLLVLALGCLGLIAFGFLDSPGWGLVALIGAPILFLFLATLMRLWCELIIVQFRIAENTRFLIPPLGGRAERLDTTQIPLPAHPNLRATADADERREIDESFVQS